MLLVTKHKSPLHNAATCHEVAGLFSISAPVIEIKNCISLGVVNLFATAL